jgi:membrane protein DedA with SNARE-associated domain
MEINAQTHQCAMADWIADVFSKLSYWGIALAMVLENAFPPIPSEAVLPGAGVAARRGELSLFGVIAAASLGSVVGALFWYYVGLWIGTERLRRWTEGWGRYFGFSPKDVDRADAWFDRWGGATVFFGRMIPGIRTLVSVPAGVAEMPLARFTLYTTAGSAIWSTLLVMLGWWAGKSSKLFEQAISWMGLAVVGAIILWIAYRFWKARRRPRGDQRSQPSERVPTPSLERRETVGVRKLKQGF